MQIIVANGYDCLTEAFRWPNLAGARKIKPGQKVHASVAFIHCNYKPKATLLKSGAEIEWEHILCRGQKDNVDWADGLQHLLEMDLFDYSSGAAITVELAKNDIHDTFFTGRLQFMASFSQGAEAISDADPNLELVCKMLGSEAEKVKEAGASLLCKIAARGSSAMLENLPKDKLAKWITMDNNKLVFNILEPVVTRYELTRTYHKLDPSSATDVYGAVLDAAVFFRFYNCFNGVSAPNSDLEKIQIEFTRLELSGDVDDPFDTPINIMPNLYRDGVIDVVIEKEDTLSDYYGLRVTNNTTCDLYMAVLSFDHINFGVFDQTTYDSTPSGQFKLGQLLKANGGSQPVGYGSSAPRLSYILEYGQETDVQLMKLLFFPKEAADVSKDDPYGFFDSDSDLQPFGTILLPVVQRLAKQN